jgi:hypothetical protein
MQYWARACLPVARDRPLPSRLPGSVAQPHQWAAIISMAKRVSEEDDDRGNGELLFHRIQLLRSKLSHGNVSSCIPHLELCLLRALSSKLRSCSCQLVSSVSLFQWCMIRWIFRAGLPGLIDGSLRSSARMANSLRIPSDVDGGG